MARSWSFADDRRVIELAKSYKWLEEAARIIKRTPERIRKVSMRLGVSFKSTPQKEMIRSRQLFDYASSITPCNRGCSD
jgi:hypothetical protein